MYNSPINIIYGQMQKQMEGDVLRAVQQYDINVDKDELIRALAYDRGQYEKGFRDGVESVQKWIPISERLPEAGETVLCLISSKECWVTTWNEIGDRMWSDGESWASETFVTHWMPLPEPPKEENQ